MALEPRRLPTGKQPRGARPVKGVAVGGWSVRNPALTYLQVGRVARIIATNARAGRTTVDPDRTLVLEWS